MVVGSVRISGGLALGWGLERSPPACHSGSCVYSSTGPANLDLLLCFWEMLLPPALFSVYDLAEVLLFREWTEIREDVRSRGVRRSRWGASVLLGPGLEGEGRGPEVQPAAGPLPSGFFSDLVSFGTATTALVMTCVAPASPEDLAPLCGCS